ncbi:MAG: hypothetical protein JW797_18650 [Bradymonadales bacterium]|nr:hypothetical protein [Bradymonadales bacterium]
MRQELRLTKTPRTGVRHYRLFATLLLLALTTLAGCPAEDDEGLRDGGTGDLRRDLPSDAPADLPQETAGDTADVQSEPQSGSVTIHVYDNGDPVTEGQAIFHHPDGSLLSQEAIGGDGLVTADLPSGAMVTIVREEELVRVTMTTIVGLQPGDDLNVGSPDAPVPFEQVGRLAVTVPQEVTDADYYLMGLGYSGFGSPTMTAPIEGSVYRADLTSGNMVNLVAIAQQRDMRLSFAMVEEIAILTTGTTSVTLPAWRTDWGSFSVSGSNAPLDSRLLNLEFQALGEHLAYDEADQAEPISPGGSATVSLSNLVTQVGDRFGYTAGVFFGQTNYTDGYSALIRADGTQPSSVALNLSADLLPRVHSVGLLTGDVSRPSITFASAGDLSACDGAVLAVAWRDEDYVQHRWNLMVPGQVASPFRLPELPEDRASWRPNIGSTYLDIPWVAFFEADFLDGYDDARQEGAGIAQATSEDIPTGATLRVSSAGGDVF